MGYPEWAVTEDGDRMWVRHDHAHRALVIAAQHGIIEPGWTTLEEDGHAAMWLDLLNPEWNDEWLLRTVEETADEAVLYAEFEVVETPRAVPTEGGQ